jgi:hypothetical protein
MYRVMLALALSSNEGRHSTLLREAFSLALSLATLPP